MNDRDVDQLVRSALDAGVADAGSHPEPDALFRYHAGELSAADADSVQGHLALCPACARAVLDFETFPHFDAPSEDDVPSAQEVEAGWADLQARLGRAPRPMGSPGAARGDEAEGPAVVPGQAASTRAGGAVVVPLTPRGAPPPRPAAPAPRAPMWLQAAAALLAVTTLGLGGYSFSLRRTLAKATEPTGNVHTIPLIPEGELARSGDASTTAPVPARAKRLWLELVLPISAPQTTYRAAILPDRGGKPLWLFDELVRNNDGTLTIDLPRSALPAGQFRIRVTAGSGEKPLEYRLEVTYE